MLDPSTLPLGRLPTPEHERAENFRMATLFPTPPAPPAATDYSHLVTDWPVYLNNEIGDCTCAAVAHMLEVFTAEVDGRAFEVTNDDVLRLYETQGYRPGHPETDRGAYLLSVLRAWRRRGIAGHRALAFAEVDVADSNEVRTAAWLFSGLYVGVNLPVSAQAQTGPGGVWDVASGLDGEPGSWGGHAVNAVAYDDAGLTVVTWGALQRMTWAFWKRYVDEAYSVIPADDARLRGRLLPNGFDMVRLLLLLHRL